MIIATIGRQKFVVASLADAEQLLHILERATPIDDEYDEVYRTYYVPDHHVDIAIEISHRELVTLEEHAERDKRKKERRAAEAAAANAMTSEPAHG